MIERSRCKRQYSARVTGELERLAHFDKAIQHILGSNLKFTNFLKRNPVEKSTTEDVYHEQYVINFFSEQAESNIKHRPLFIDKSQNVPERKKTTETKKFEHFRITKTRTKKLRSTEIHIDQTSRNIQNGK